MLPKIGKEITKTWKPIVKSNRAQASAKGVGTARVNPLASAGNELRGRASSSRASNKSHL